MSTPTVYIEPGCICCQACVTTTPDVFLLPDDRAVISGLVRVDGITSPNADERASLVPNLDWEMIREAAAGCPVDVIRIA
jgi:ferredoxin